MIQDTSLKAWLNEIAPTLGARQIAILEAFELDQRSDFTNAELSVFLDKPINTVTPRVFELRELGILEESRKRQCTVTRREVHAWRLKDRPAISPRAISPIPVRYQMPSISQPGKTHSIVARDGKPACDCKGFLFRKTCSHIENLKRQVPRPEETMNSLFA